MNQIIDLMQEREGRLPDEVRPLLTTGQRVTNGRKGGRRSQARGAGSPGSLQLKYPRFPTRPPAPHLILCKTGRNKVRSEPPSRIGAPATFWELEEKGKSKKTVAASSSRPEDDICLEVKILQEIRRAQPGTEAGVCVLC